MLTRIRTYVHETVQELLHKVSWPSWKDLQNSAIIVLVASIMIALAIFVMDYVFGVNSPDAPWRGILGYIYEILQTE
jgi:preprotein translocase subunit SecE